MTTIYLDQNKWIDLAKARLRLGVDGALKGSLAAITQRVADGDWAVPLSATHYMELARIKKPHRRRDLGETMWQVSRGQTLASPSSMMHHEIDEALAKRIPGLQKRPFSLLGRGAAHAFGMPDRQYEVPAFARPRLSREDLATFQSMAQEVIERSLLTGSTPDGIAAPTMGFTEHNARFMQHLVDLPEILSDVPRDKWHDVLMALSIIDIKEPLAIALEHHALEWSRLNGHDRTELSRLLLDLPSRVVDLHMHWQMAKNPNLRPKQNDLEDWAALIPAAVYCDVMVCEKHFADLLGRERFKPHAEVITDVRELRNLL